MAESTEVPEGDTTTAPTTVDSVDGVTPDPTPAEGTNPVVTGAIDTSEADDASKDEAAADADQQAAEVSEAQAEHLKNSPEHKQEAADNAQANADNAETFAPAFPRFESSEHFHGQVKESLSGAIVAEVTPVGWVGPWLTVGYDRIEELVGVLNALLADPAKDPEATEDVPAS